MSRGTGSWRRKWNDEPVFQGFLDFRKGDGRYGVSKWILFCEEMLRLGYKVTLKETPGTYSKYVKVHDKYENNYLVRFSDHKPNYGRELNGDCDFFVGITNLQVTTWQDAVGHTRTFFERIEEAECASQQSKELSSTGVKPTESKLNSNNEESGWIGGSYCREGDPTLLSLSDLAKLQEKDNKIQSTNYKC